MPLLDHFHSPLSERRYWHSFLNSWATYLSSQLNTLLPAGYFAEANVQFGVEIDVATFEEPGATGAPSAWAPPPPASHPFEMAGVVVEVVTERPSDLHRELLVRLGVADPGPGPALSGSAFRPVERDGKRWLDVWREPIAVGQPLPTLPLWLRGDLCCRSSWK